jgi:hypothetical protein
MEGFGQEFLAELLRQALAAYGWWGAILAIVAVALLAVLWRRLPKTAPDPDPTDDPGLPPMPNPPPPERKDGDP